ncbi:winged helix-turn-helix domain-containing protein [Catellatospora sp. NPDC049609]|uniref:winged helix-turn-helix domain-containing protein n=1 Tax=Catellatospora sp. NPDC049609 TaxID=3155505 RepID=UPI00341A27CB
MAHPVRLKLVNELVLGGAATATELAERVGESPANCSWHLRQLAKWGYIEEAEGGVGRNRPWRWVPVGNRWGSAGDSPELLRVGAELNALVLSQELALREAWDEQRLAEPEPWRHAGFTVQNIAWLTAEELAEIETAIVAMTVNKYGERFGDPAQRPEGSRPVRLVAWAHPAR